jgi:hypothetical protein
MTKLTTCDFVYLGPFQFGITPFAISLRDLTAREAKSEKSREVAVAAPGERPKDCRHDFSGMDVDFQIVDRILCPPDRLQLRPPT